MKQTRVAIVHDWLYGGGAELVVEELHKLYPGAPIYTSYCSDEWRERLNSKVVTGYLQNWPFAQLRKFLPVLRQHWFKNLDLSDFDLVISSCGNGEARFVCVKKPAIHISYTHTPTHFYWRKYSEYLKNPSFKPKWLARLGLRTLVKPLRKRDYEAAQRVDYFIANSSHIQNDIKKYYNRESTVIHPPVDTEKFSKKQKAKSKTSKPVASSNITHQLSDIDKPSGFITWGRHVPYKRFDLAIQACNELKANLTIVGSGPATESLKKIAGPTITFTGRISDKELVALAHSSKAFLFPGEEDFGIAPVEALAAGLPVIAFKSGGALDYIREDQSGAFFRKQTVEALVSCLKDFNAKIFKPKIVQTSAEQYTSKQFQAKMTEFVSSKIQPKRSTDDK